MVALVKRHESTKLLESVIKMPIFYEPKITVTAPPNELNLGLARRTYFQIFINNDFFIYFC